MTLDRFFQFIEAVLPFRANLDDLAGFSQGSGDLNLRPEHRSHDTKLCQLAKSQPSTDHRCRLCKVAANRAAIRTKGVSNGTCHLGLSDWTLDIKSGGQSIGVLYLGSVRIVEHLARDRARLLASCEKEGLAPDAAISAWESTQAVTLAEFEKGRAAIVAIGEFLDGILENAGLHLLPFQAQLKAHLTGRYHRLPPHISKALAVMQKEFDTPLRAHDLCRRVGCSPGHFSRSFSETVGMSFTDCLVQIRLNRSRRLLRRTNLQVSEIAAQTGFADQTHFGRSFRKAYGATPSEFRRLLA